jgi:hypothetical protein
MIGRALVGATLDLGTRSEDRTSNRNALYIHDIDDETLLR